jgi:hypothetical protein
MNFKTMANLIKTLTSLDIRSLYRGILSLVAVILVVTTTACNGSTPTAKVENPNLNNPSSGKITELYKPIAPAQGGMNNYSDVDPRQNTAEAKAKADRLIKKTDDLQNGGTNPFKQLRKQFDDKGIPERVEDAAKDLNRSTQKTADDVAKGTQRGFNNLKENTKSFKDDVDSAVENLGDKAKAKTNDLKDNIRNAG